MPFLHNVSIAAAAVPAPAIVASTWAATIVCTSTTTSSLIGHRVTVLVETMGLRIGVKVLILSFIVSKVCLSILAEEDLLILEKPLGLFTDNSAKL